MFAWELSDLRTYWKYFATLAIIVGFVASCITIYGQLYPVIISPGAVTTTSLFPGATLTMKVVPEYQWTLLPDGNRITTIPSNKSATFHLLLNNTGHSAFEIWGSTIRIEYPWWAALWHPQWTVSNYNDTVLRPGEQAVFTWIYGSNLPRSPDVNRAQLVFTVFGPNQSWQASTTILVRFEP
jgi:hypothetical protein